MRSQMDFDSFSDSLRVAAAQRYGINSNEFARSLRRWSLAVCTARTPIGSSVSRITSRSTIEHGLVVVGHDGRGYTIVRDASGREFFQSPSQLLSGGGRDVTLGADGRFLPVSPRSSTGRARGVDAPSTATGGAGAPSPAIAPGSAWNTASTSPTTRGAQPSLINRLLGRTIGNPTTQPAQLVEREEQAREEQAREERERVQREAALTQVQEDLADLQRLLDAQ